LHSEAGEHLIDVFRKQSAPAFNNVKHFWPMKNPQPLRLTNQSAEEACPRESGSSATPVGVSDADPPEVLRLTPIISPRVSNLRQNSIS